MAEEIGFSDIDPQKERWICGVWRSNHLGHVQCPEGHSKRLAAEESQSHQNRFVGSKMLLGLGGRESRVMPYLVLRLIRYSGGLVAGPDCITRLFWVPGSERGVYPLQKLRSIL